MTEFLSRIFIKDHKNTENPEVRSKYGYLSSFVGITVNLILSALKLVLGIITASIAVVADALNNLSDAGSSIVTLVSFKMAAKPADKDHPFGHARIEYIASMIVSFLILFVGFETLTSSISGIFNPDSVKTPDFSTITIILLGSSILLKLWLGLFYKTVGKKINSSVISASAADSIMDSISTFSVFVCAIIVKFTNFAIIDSIVGIALSGVIIVAGIKILNETKNSILGEAPLEETVEKIMSIVEQYPEVIGTHDLMLHNYGPNVYIGSFHAEVDGSQDIYMLHDVIDNIERHIQSELNVLCTIHLDPIVTNDETVNALKAFLLKVIDEKIDENLSVHDFRVVVGTTHTNMIFDIVLPFESKYTPEGIINKISEEVTKEKEDYFCVITVDRG